MKEFPTISMLNCVQYPRFVESRWWKSQSCVFRQGDWSDLRDLPILIAGESIASLPNQTRRLGNYIGNHDRLAPMLESLQPRLPSTK
jgi:hypothetical protein